MKNNIDMKSLMKIAFSLLAGLCLMASCNDSDDDKVSGLTLSTQEITLGADGGTEKVNVAAGTKWVAKADKPWVKVMPANGIGAAECKIVVDSTLTNDIRNAVITFVPEGAPKQELKVNQTGYGKMIGLSEQAVTVANMGAYDKRNFEITVTANVDFKVVIPDDSKWVTLDKNPSLSLDYGARPRTVKVKFNWAMNTIDQKRIAEIKFVPKNAGDVLEKEIKLEVAQDAAPTITDDRAGDSIALLITNTKLNSMNAWDSSEKMQFWVGVTLWEKTDEGVKPEMVGRVRKTEFRVFSTKESLPLELGKLKYLETLIVYGNTNTMLLPDKFEMGTALANLEYLRNLTVAAYGLTTINPTTELAKSRLKLKYLNIRGNNFTTLPSQLSSSYFPDLESLELSGMRRWSSITDMREGAWRENAGMKVDVGSYQFVNLLKWEKLKYLALSYNYLYGQLPKTVSGINKKWSDAAYIASNDTIADACNDPNKKAKLNTVPAVLPNAEFFAINLNFITGDLPDWILYHPRFARFNPFALIMTQENGYDPEGNVPRFDNEPVSFDEFYDFYPKAKPSKID